MHMLTSISMVCRGPMTVEWAERVQQNWAAEGGLVFQSTPSPRSLLIYPKKEYLEHSFGPLHPSFWHQPQALHLMFWTNHGLAISHSFSPQGGGGVGTAPRLAKVEMVSESSWLQNPPHTVSDSSGWGWAFGGQESQL